MIDISELRKEDIGKWVLYSGGAGETEKGRLKSWNDKFIFVVYKCDYQWDKFQDYTGVATSQEDLRWTTFDEVVSIRREGKNKLTIDDLPKIDEADVF